MKNGTVLVIETYPRNSPSNLSLEPKEVCVINYRVNRETVVKFWADYEIKLNNY